MLSAIAERKRRIKGLEYIYIYMCEQVTVSHSVVQMGITAKATPGGTLIGQAPDQSHVIIAVISLCF